MTYKQYMDLKNQYREMAEELRRYNDFRNSQPRSNAPQQPLRMPNLDTVQSDSLKTKEST